jgi:hypothetical protein
MEETPGSDTSPSLVEEIREGGRDSPLVEPIAHDIGDAPREHFAWGPYPYQRDVLDAVVLHGKRRLAWIAGRRVGKSEGIAQLVLQLAVRRPGLEVVVFAPSQSQAAVIARKVRYHLAGSKWEDKTPGDNVGELVIRHGTDADGKPVDSRILCMTLSGKVRGEAADVLVIDESAFCESEDYRNKALPFVVDRPDSVIVHNQHGVGRGRPLHAGLPPVRRAQARGDLPHAHDREARRHRGHARGV